MSRRVAIIGGGAFGSALATVAARAGHDVLIYLRDQKTLQTINESHTNPQKLCDILLPDEIRATTIIGDLQDSEFVFFAVPAQQTRMVAGKIGDGLSGANHMIACAKGIEQNTGAFQHQILAEQFSGQAISVLSGPGFASEIARKLPTALTIASDNINRAKEIAALLSIPSFRLYSSSDPVGAEIGGALKNVLAIAVGIARGMELGASAEAALIARGFAELARLGSAMGARNETLAGLSGLGDLVLTCSSPQSRNFSYGMALATRTNLDGLPLAEGVYTARMAARLATRHKVEAPIITAVADVLSNKLSPKEAVDALLSRPLRSETG